MIQENRPEHQLAIDSYIKDVWFDGNEEIIEVGAICPNENCLNPVVTSFTRPNIRAKTLIDRRCGFPMTVVRPAFGFEGSGDMIDAQKMQSRQSFQPGIINRMV